MALVGVTLIDQADLVSLSIQFLAEGFVRLGARTRGSRRIKLINTDV